MLNPIPDTGIDFILNLNTESTSLVDVLVTTHDEIPPSSVTTLPSPPIPLIQPLQQTLVSTPIIVPSASLQNLPTFGSLFKFEDRVKSLEDDFSEFKQTNLFVEAVSSIPGNVDKYLANQMNEAKIIKEQVKVQVNEQVSKILLRIEKSVNEQLEAKVLIRSSNDSKTSHDVAANLSELELKKILIDIMENNKSIDRSVQQKTLYKALVDAYETDKDILTTYRDTVTFKRCRDDVDEDEEPSVGSNRGSKRRRAGKEPESSSAPKEKTSKSSGKSKEGSKSHQKSTGKSAQAEEPTHTIKDLEEPVHQEFNTGFTEDQPVDETTQLPDWESARNVYSRHRVIAVTNLQILGVESYQKKLNLTRSDMYRSDLKQLPTYSVYPNPRGFIYQNKDKKNKLMRIDELHKFSDGTLNDVRTALDDILKRIRMKYLP
ncbi:hypothetical protein Tco_0523571 [Tanacetum coccineum]